MDVQLLMQFAQSDYALSSHRVAENMTPTQSQYNLEPGDCAYVLAITPAEVDNDLILVQLTMQDDELVRDAYPDFEDRLANGWVHCTWTSSGDREANDGWFARCQLVPIPPETYAEVLGDFFLGIRYYEETHHQAYPSLLRAHREHVAQTTQIRDMTKMGAIPVTCEKCDSLQVHIELTEHRITKSTAAWTQRDGEERELMKAGTFLETNDVTVKIICEDCGNVTHVDPDALSSRCNNPTHHHH